MKTKNSDNFGSVVFETNIINFLLKHQKSVIVKKELPYVRFSFTYFLLLKKVILHAGMLQAQSSLSS